MFFSTTAMVFSAAFFCVLIVAFRPVSKLIRDALKNNVSEIHGGISLWEEKLASLRMELDEHKQKNEALQQRIDQILLDAETHCKRLRDQIDIELQQSANEKLESTLKRISNYSALILQELRESSVDIAVSAMYKMLAKYPDGKLDGLNLLEVSKDMRKKLN